MPVKKLAVGLMLFCLASTCVSGQAVKGDEGMAKGALPSFVRLGDVAAESARLLQSRSNRERAWGAYLAGRNNLRELAPALVEMLADPILASGGREEWVTRQSALDALIRLDVEVDAGRLLPLYQIAPDEVTILLARSPQKNQTTLLSLFDEELTDARWLAIGNLLAGARAQGFAARLLKGLKVDANVFVFDREGPHNIGSNGGSGGGCGGSFYMPDDDGLPPVSYYALTCDAERGATVVAPGRHVVYFVRSLATGGRGGCENWRPFHDRDDVRVEYLTDLLNTTEEELKFEAHPWREIVCKDAAQCRRALAGVRDEIAGSHSALLTRLLGESLLDPAEASELKPDITLDITDYRDRKTFPLPDKLGGVTVSLNEADEPACCADKLPAPESNTPDGPGVPVSPELESPDPPL